MAATVVNDGLDLLAKLLLGKASGPSALVLRLYVNPVALGPATKAADLTECTAPGYAAVGMTAGNWTGQTAAGLSSWSYPTVTFNFTDPGAPPQTIQGYFVTDTKTGLLLWCEALSAAFPLQPGGGQIAVTVVWKDQQCP